MSKDEFKEMTVGIGYHGQWVPIKFVGKELFSTTNKDEYANRDRYHLWRLFAQQGGGYRVMDMYLDDRDRDNRRQNTQLSRRMTGGEVARQYPELVVKAMEEKILTVDDVALDADHRDLLDEERDILEAMDLAEQMDGPQEEISDLLTRKIEIDTRLKRYRRW